MIKWLRELIETKDILDVITTAPYHDWDTCFMKFGYGFLEVKYSGRSIYIKDETELYECLVLGDIRWINKDLLRFPKSL